MRREHPKTTVALQEKYIGKYLMDLVLRTLTALFAAVS